VKPWDVIGYAADADVFCEDCTRAYYGALPQNTGKDIEDWRDEEGNNIAPVFEDDESDSPTHCGDCGRFLGGSLTTDGEDYVIEQFADELRRFGELRSETLRQWAEAWPELLESARADL
jgi:quinol monooxygenase YgiN